MKDKDGFTIRCKDAHWEICDNRDNKDYICRGNSEHYGMFCPFDDRCRGYVPDIKEKKHVDTV